MPEIPSRLCNDEVNGRQPSAGTYKEYYKATAVTFFGLGVCNAAGVDVHVNVYLLGAVESAAAGWVTGTTEPPPYTRIVYKQLIEAEAVQGNVWEMPTVILDINERIAVFTDTVGVTFNGHGIRQVGDPTP